MQPAGQAAGAFYKLRVKGTTFELPRKYTNIRWLGGGSYGHVVAAECSPGGAGGLHRVAIKRVGGVFRNRVDAKRILREMRILRHLRSHANVVGILDMFHSPSSSSSSSKGHRAPKFEDVYMVTQLFESDLHRIITSEQPLSDAHARYFTYQILRGLKYVHSANIIHRDLKPANLLINSDCGLAICDFGLSRGIQNLNDSAKKMPLAKQADDLTHYVVTRWYRAPELLAENEAYGKAIDVWSVGCILGEILGRRVLFKGRDYLDQLHCILCVLGTPDPRKDLSFVTKPECRRVIRNMGIKAAVPWSKLFPRAETQALDLLGKLLAWNPVNRITVEEALRHPWLGEYHDESREPSCLVSFDFDNNTSDLAGDLPVSKIRRLMSAEISKMRSEEASERDESALTDTARGGEGNRDGPAAVVPAKSRDIPVAPPSVPPTPPPAPPANSSRAPSSCLPIAQEAEIARDISAAAISAVQKDLTGQLKSGVLAEDGLLQSMLRRELEKMEVRILSQMRVVVDQVVTKRLKEFAQALEDEGVGHE